MNGAYKYRDDTNFQKEKTNINLNYNFFKMTEIEIKIWTKQDFIELAKLDYTNTYDKIFDISYIDSAIHISEIDLPNPVTNASKIYTDEILEDMIERLNNPNAVPLVVFFDGSPAWYTMSKREKRPNGKVLVIDGVLVANRYAWKGFAIAMLQKTIEIAKQDPECRGVHAEMDTTKYQANKLLLKSWFKFAWTKFFIYSKQAPHKYSKEAVYFYYPL